MKKGLLLLSLGLVACQPLDFSNMSPEERMEAAQILAGGFAQQNAIMQHNADNLLAVGMANQKALEEIGRPQPNIFVEP
jgi:hypothetical protein